MNELESLEENLEETSTAYWEIEKLCMEMLDKCKVCCDDCEEGKGSFMRRNNKKRFNQEVEKLIKKLKKLGVLIQTPSTDNRKKYKWSGNSKKWVGVLKELKNE
tara:strand:- start:69 stop:380 length:312 start_codon:yes stop_codon:yes gene_type:complete